MKRLILAATISAIQQVNAKQIEETTTSASRYEYATLSSKLVSSDSIQRDMGVHSSTLLSRQPAVWISRGHGQESLIAMRSPVLTGKGGCASFLILENSVPTRAPGFCNVNQLFDLNITQASAVEISYGPNTSDWGGNHLHGGINTRVSLGESNRKELSVATTSEEMTRLALAIDQNKEASWGVRLLAENNNGYVDSSGYQQYKLNAQYKIKGEQSSHEFYLSTSDLDQQSATFVKGYESYKDDELKQSNAVPNAFRLSRHALFYYQLNRTLQSDLNLVLRPYARYADMDFTMHYLPAAPEEANGQQGVGIQFQIDQRLEKLAYSIGADIDLSEAELQQFQAAETFLFSHQGYHYNYGVDMQTLAIFADLNYALNDELELIAGLRWDDTRYSYNNYLSAGTSDECTTSSGCRYFRPDDSVDEFSATSYNLGLRFAPSEAQQFSLVYGSAFRAPQITELYSLQAGQSQANLDTVILEGWSLDYRWQYTELGTLSASLYLYSKLNDIFQNDLRENISGAQFDYRGIDVNIDHGFTESLTLTMNLSWAQHQHANSLKMPFSTVAQEGAVVDTSPEWQSNITINWMPVDTLSWDFTLNYISEYTVDTAGEHLYEGHTLASTWLDYYYKSNWKISLGIDNLFDVDYAERADYAFGDYRYFVGLPRRAMFKASYVF